MIVNAKKFSDIVLVYDQYYAKKPNAVLLLLERIALCSGLCVCAMMFLLAEYSFPVSRLMTVGLSVLFSAGFSLLFAFVKKRVAIPAVVLLGTLIGLFSWEEIMGKLSYFADALWLLMDGRIVPGKILVDHDLDMLTPQSLMYCEGVEFGFGLLIFVFSMITAACMVSKPKILPSLVVWVALWTPVLISENFTFSPWIIPTLALYMGTIALSALYGQGIAVGRGFSGSYREANVRGERNFTNSLARAPYLKQVEMRTVYYSKYFAVVMYAVTVFAALGIIVGGVFSASEGIDYTKLYDFVISLGDNSPLNNPFEKGPASDWFADPEVSSSSQVYSLSITNPGRGNQEILKVSNAGNSVVYLRGDIGIDFNGESWTSPVNAEPEEWKSSGLSEYYRPVELLVLSILQNVLEEGIEERSVSEAEVVIEYLCDSTVIFLPAYTSGIGYFDNEMFNIYGDFVERVDASFDKMNSVHCTALVPGYTNTDNSSAETGLLSLRSAVEAAKYNGRMEDIVSGSYFTGHPEALEDYRNYVYKTYSEVPAEYTAIIRDYISKSGFDEKAALYSAEEDELVARYMTACEVADYLRSNYRYSLNTNNSGENPINSFLNVTKSGHCAMYASSMTLILREMGIPARYCTGFVVAPNGGEATVLRSKNLHAWVEVYLDELGWVTFDPTSSSQLGNAPEINERPELPSSPDASSSEESSEESSASEHESSDSEISSDAESSTSDTSSEIPQDNNNDNIVKIILIIAVPCAIIAVIIGCGAVMLKKFEKQSKKALKETRTKGSCEEHYAKIIEIIKLCGFTQRPGEQPRKFFKRVDMHLKTKLAVHTNLLLKIAFSKSEFSRDEVCETAAMLENVFYSAKQQLVFMGLLRLYRIVLRSKTDNSAFKK